MTKSLYTAQAHVTGGREHGHGVTSDGALDVQLRTPVEMGGEGGGTNPEQLFAVGYAACFEGALGVVGRRERAGPRERLDRIRGQPDHHREPGLQRGRGTRCHASGNQRARARHFDRGSSTRGMPVLQCDARQRRGDPQGQRSAGANRSLTMD